MTIKTVACFALIGLTLFGARSVGKANETHLIQQNQSIESLRGSSTQY